MSQKNKFGEKRGLVSRNKKKRKISKSPAGPYKNSEVRLAGVELTHNKYDGLNGKEGSQKTADESALK